MAATSNLRRDYPWTASPLIVCAPMTPMASPSLALAVSQAGGLGFLGAGFDLNSLDQKLQHTADLMKHSQFPPANPDHHHAHLPIGVGFLNWGADLDLALQSVKKFGPAAVWFFAPENLRDLIPWTERIRQATEGRTKIWIQIGTVSEALEAANLCNPDVLVVQGADAGGHGLQLGAGIISLLPEIFDALKSSRGEGRGRDSIALVAAGGVVEGRAVAASVILGAHGVAMGTRFLASTEAQISKAYQHEVLKARDGGASTVRSKLCDNLNLIPGYEGSPWPERYDGRFMVNRSFLDAEEGMEEEENRRLFVEARRTGPDQGWGLNGRFNTYVGTGVGLITEVKSGGEIVREVREEANRVLKNVVVLC